MPVSMAVSGSGSSSRSRAWSGTGRCGGSTSSSPIPYREGPLDYSPEVRCKCGEKAARWISWSDDSPGRRYLKCFNARSGGCDFWEWYEEPGATPFIAQLLVDLRDAVRSLKKENKELKGQVLDRRPRMEEHRCLVDQLRQQVEDADRLRKEFAGKEEEVAALARRLKKLEKERWFMCVVLGFMVVAIGLMCSA